MQCFAVFLQKRHINVFKIIHSDSTGLIVSMHYIFCFQFRLKSSSSLDPDSGRDLVVLHPDHPFIVHRQLGRLPHRRTDGHAHRVGRRPCRSERNKIWNPGRGFYHDIFQVRYCMVRLGLVRFNHDSFEVS